MKLLLIISFILISFQSYTQVFTTKIFDNTTLREEPVWNGKEIIELKKDDKVQVLELLKNFAKISISKNNVTYTGFVSKTMLDESKEYDVFNQIIKDSLEKVEIEKKEKEKEAWNEYIKNSKLESDSIENRILKRKEQEAKDQEQARINKEKEKQLSIEKYRKKYGNNSVDKALNKNVWVGMPSDLIEIAWGEPEVINSTETKYSIHYQYVFSGNRYIYVENGVVTTIQK